MGRKKKVTTEREEEAKAGRNTFSLPIPTSQKSLKETLPVLEKTSLFVPAKEMFNVTTGFQSSSFSGEVLITRNIPEVLKAVFRHGDVAKRYGESGLENDPSRLQIIIYTMVVCQKNLLWYQRSSPGSNKQKKFIGEPRLQGRFTVGFGGHKTAHDISISREELVFLNDVLPGIRDGIGTMLGLNKGFFSEVEEEVGIGRDGVSGLKLLGAFYDKRIEDPVLPVQVGWVHLGIASVLEINPAEVNQLSFRTSEIAKAWWVPFSGVEAELSLRNKDWYGGKGPKVETWTEVVIREFWKDYKLSVL